MTEEQTPRASRRGSAHAEFIREVAPIVEKGVQSRERQLQLDELTRAGASEATRRAVMDGLTLHHAERLRRLEERLERPLDSLIFR